MKINAGAMSLRSDLALLIGIIGVPCYGNDSWLNVTAMGPVHGKP